MFSFQRPRSATCRIDSHSVEGNFRKRKSRSWTVSNKFFIFQLQKLKTFSLNSDWEWGQQDGGEGKTGRVMEIRGWDNESCRSVANVSWVTGSTNVYRLGHKGNVDLKYVSPAPGGYYYKDHMPVLGQRDEQQPVVQATRPIFCVGDRVRVCLDKESLMRLQQGEFKERLNSLKMFVFKTRKFKNILKNLNFF